MVTTSGSLQRIKSSVVNTFGSKNSVKKKDSEQPSYSSKLNQTNESSLNEQQSTRQIQHVPQTPQLEQEPPTETGILQSIPTNYQSLVCQRTFPPTSLTPTHLLQLYTLALDKFHSYEKTQINASQLSSNLTTTLLDDFYYSFLFLLRSILQQNVTQMTFEQFETSTRILLHCVLHHNSGIVKGGVITVNDIVSHPLFAQPSLHDILPSTTLTSILSEPNTQSLGSRFDDMTFLRQSSFGVFVRVALQFRQFERFSDVFAELESIIRNLCLHLHIMLSPLLVNFLLEALCIAPTPPAKIEPHQPAQSNNRPRLSDHLIATPKLSDFSSNPTSPVSIGRFDVFNAHNNRLLQTPKVIVSILRCFLLCIQQGFCAAFQEIQLQQSHERINPTTKTPPTLQHSLYRLLLENHPFSSYFVALSKTILSAYADVVLLSTIILRILTLCTPPSTLLRCFSQELDVNQRNSILYVISNQIDTSVANQLNGDWNHDSVAISAASASEETISRESSSQLTQLFSSLQYSSISSQTCSSAPHQIPDSCVLFHTFVSETSPGSETPRRSNRSSLQLALMPTSPAWLHAQYTAVFQFIPIDSILQQQTVGNMMIDPSGTSSHNIYLPCLLVGPSPPPVHLPADGHDSNIPSQKRSSLTLSQQTPPVAKRTRSHTPIIVDSHPQFSSEDEAVSLEGIGETIGQSNTSHLTLPPSKLTAEQIQRGDSIAASLESMYQTFMTNKEEFTWEQFRQMQALSQELTRMMIDS